MINTESVRWAAARLLARFFALSAVLVSGCLNHDDTTRALLVDGSSPSHVTPFAASTNGSDTLERVTFLPPPDTNVSVDVTRIAKNDLLKIDVFQVDELDRTIRVDANGAISMPLIGIVDAAGQTIPELEETLETRYAQDYLQNPQITVFVEESFAQRVTVDGEFVRSGIYPITHQSTLLDAIAQARGLSPVGDEEKIFLYRRFSDGVRVVQISLQDVRAGREPNPRVFAGDTIVAFKSGRRVAFQNLKEALGLATTASRFGQPL
ncbi:MAG: polysaccharide biosynthesis/export family protein [Pseudomonadota bacterium]